MPSKQKLIKTINQNDDKNQQQSITQSIPSSSIFSSFNTKQPSSILFTTSTTPNASVMSSSTNSGNFTPSFGNNINVTTTQPGIGNGQKKVQQQQQMVQVYFLKLILKSSQKNIFVLFF